MEYYTYVEEIFKAIINAGGLKDVKRDEIPITHLNW